MRNRSWLIACCVAVVLSGSIAAQSANDAVTAFKSSLLNHQFTLRNFSGETKVRGEWSGDALKMDKPQWRAMGVLAMKSVAVDGREVKIECVRYILVHGSAGNLVLSPQSEPVEIQIKIRDGEPATVLPQLKEALFFATPAEALAAIPVMMKDGIPASIRPTNLKGVPTTAYFNTGDGYVGDGTNGGYSLAEMDCGCVAIRNNKCLGSTGEVEGTAPRITGSPVPEMTEGAIDAHASGSVRIALALNTKGLVADTWIARPVGFDMDEKVADVYRFATFHPATCHNTPVPSTVYVEYLFGEMKTNP